MCNIAQHKIIVPQIWKNQKHFVRFLQNFSAARFRNSSPLRHAQEAATAAKRRSAKGRGWPVWKYVADEDDRVAIYRIVSDFAPDRYASADLVHRRHQTLLEKAMRREKMMTNGAAVHAAGAAQNSPCRWEARTLPFYIEYQPPPSASLPGIWLKGNGKLCITSHKFERTRFQDHGFIGPRRPFQMLFSP
jgi:hypothetical protein